MDELTVELGWPLPRKRKLELHTLLVVRTSHLSKPAISQLYHADRGVADGNGGVWVDHYDYGWHLRLTNDRLDKNKEQPDQSILDIVALANSVGATHVRVDQNGPIVPTLKIY